MLEAETTVDSILKEIDMEMPENKNKYVLPLQDIGDETMDMLVNYNTQNNAVSGWKEVPHQNDLVPIQNQYDDDNSEGMDDENDNLLSGNLLTEEETEKVTIDNKNMALPPSSSKSNLINNLKEEVGLEDSHTTDDGEDAQTLNFSMKSTEPLIGNSESTENLIEVRTVFSESGLELEGGNSDNEDQEMISRAKKAVSPARIPITNAQTINNFSKGTVSFNEDVEDDQEEDYILNSSMKTDHKDSLGSVPDLSFSSSKHSPYKGDNIYEALQSVENLEIRDVDTCSSEEESEKESKVIQTIVTNINPEEHMHEFKTIASSLPALGELPEIPHENANGSTNDPNSKSEPTAVLTESKSAEAVSSHSGSSHSLSYILENRQEASLENTLKSLNVKSSGNTPILPQTGFSEIHSNKNDESPVLNKTELSEGEETRSEHPGVSSESITSRATDNDIVAIPEEKQEIEAETASNLASSGSSSNIETVTASIDLKDTKNKDSEDVRNMDSSFATELKGLLHQTTEYDSENDHSKELTSAMNNLEKSNDKEAEKQSVEDDIIPKAGVESTEESPNLLQYDNNKSSENVDEYISRENSEYNNEQATTDVPEIYGKNIETITKEDSNAQVDKSNNTVDESQTIASSPVLETDTIDVNISSVAETSDEVNSDKNISSTSSRVSSSKVENSSRISSTSSRMSSGKVENSSRISSLSSSAFTPVLPPLPTMEKLTINEFSEEGDTSNESIDVFKSVKPTDYLSIWHIQQQSAKPVSPAVSANSQFTYNSASTKTSTPSPVITPGPFTFKPKVVSRSKYYYPESTNVQIDKPDDFIYRKLPSLLDPMRRNTSTSRKIREKLISQKKFHAITPKKESNVQIVDTREKPSKPQEQISPINAEVNNRESMYSAVETVTTTDSQMYVTPSGTMENLNIIQANASVDEDFENILNYMDKHVNNEEENDQYKFESTKTGEKLWHEGLDLQNDTVTDKSMKPYIMEKLLRSDSNELEARPEVEEKISDENLGLGILRTSVNNISTGKVDESIANGRDISISRSDISHINTQNNSGDKTPETKTSTPKLSPVRGTHVGSPFKVIRSPKKNTSDFSKPTVSSNATNEEDVANEAIKLSIAGAAKSINNESTTDSVSVISNSVERKSSKTKLSEQLSDDGMLYLQLTGTSKLNLSGISNHKPKYSFEFDNGINVARTPWKELSSSGTISMDKEFELPIINRVNTKYVITLKLQYSRLANEIVEVTRKVPMGKKFPFGKMKYKTETKFVERATNKDEWDYLFARDGSFGRCEIEVDENILKKCQFSEESLEFDLVNKWSRLANNSSSKIDPSSLYDLPRRPPYVIGKLKLNACYFQRISNLEKFPVSMKKAHDIVKKYRHQQEITMEGFLLQEGGDVKSQMKNRYFKLHGNELIGYHEVTRKPKININLLKVVKVVGKDDIATNKDAVRNFTAWVLMSDCFQLVFDDGEVITFSAESSHEEKQSWYIKLKETIELNAFHQPWVKRFSDNLIYKEI